MITDLSAVAFLDSAALAVLTRYWKKTRDAGGILILAGPQQQSDSILQLTGVAERRPMYDTVATAAATLPNSTGGN